MARRLTPRAPPQSDFASGLTNIAAVVASSCEEQEGLGDDLLLEEQTQLKMSFEKFSPLQMMNVFTGVSHLWRVEEIEEGIFSRPSEAKITLIKLVFIKVPFYKSLTSSQSCGSGLS